MDIEIGKKIKQKSGFSALVLFEYDFFGLLIHSPKKVLSHL